MASIERNYKVQSESPVMTASPPPPTMGDKIINKAKEALAGVVSPISALFDLSEAAWKKIDPETFANKPPGPSTTAGVRASLQLPPSPVSISDELTNLVSGMFNPEGAGVKIGAAGMIVGKKGAQVLADVLGNSEIKQIAKGMADADSRVYSLPTPKLQQLTGSQHTFTSPGDALSRLEIPDLPHNRAINVENIHAAILDQTGRQDLADAVVAGIKSAPNSKERVLANADLGDIRRATSAVDQTQVTMSLGDIYNNPSLYIAYPELKNYTVNFDPYSGFVNQKQMSGSFNQSSKEFTVNSVPYLDAFHELFAHETTHGIQDIEDFARGGSTSNLVHLLDPNQFVDEFTKSAKNISLSANTTSPIEERQILFNMYQRLSGEAEARAVQNRLTDKSQNFDKSYDIDLSNLINVFK